MKKLLLYGLKYLNHFTNEPITVDEEAKQILKYMLFKNNVERTLAVKKSLDAQCRNLMYQEKSKALKIVESIDNAYDFDLKLINN